MTEWRWLYLAPLVLTAVFLAQNDGRFFAEWRFDASTERLMRRVADDINANKPRGFTTKLVVNNMMRETAQYFHKRRQWYWVEEIVPAEKAPADAEYFILIAGDRALAQSLGLEPLLEDPLSGSFVARRVQ